MVALGAAIRLARGDATALQLLDTSMAGFWRSFGAIFIVAPIYLIAMTAEMQLSEAVAGVGMTPDFGFYLARLVTLGIDWIAYPAAMVFVARMLALSRVYAAYIVAYNWTSVVIVVVLTAPALGFSIGLLSATLASIASLIITLWALYFRFYVARIALGAPVGTAIGLVIFDFALSLSINLASEGLTG
jgi:hypothetical protein